VKNKKGGDAGSYRCIVQTPLGAVSSKTVTLLTAGKYLNLIFFKFLHDCLLFAFMLCLCIQVDSKILYTMSLWYYVLCYILHKPLFHIKFCSPVLNFIAGGPIKIYFRRGSKGRWSSPFVDW